MKAGNLIVISAPSGAGKTTLCKNVLNIIDNLRFSISYTTRRPRPNEVDGRDYYFIDEKKFREMIEREEFLEWAYVHGNLYGTSRTVVQECLSKGFDILLDIDVQGAEQVKRIYTDAIMVFIMPPSFDILRERLIRRGAENVELRLKRAYDEMRRYSDYDYVIINDNLEEAIDHLKAIIVSERLRTKRFDPTVIGIN